MNDYLTTEEEIALAKRRDAGDQTAIAEMMERNEPLVLHYAAPSIRRQPNEGDDLIGAARLGLLRAAKKYDPARGTRFSTYAVWAIRRSVQRHNRCYSRLIRIPEHQQDPKRAAEASEESQRDAWRAIGLKPGKVQLSDDSDPLLELPDRPQPPEFDHPDLDRMLSALRQLHPRHRHILELRYGLQGGDPLLLKEVGDLEGITRERVRQIEAKAMAKLRQIMLGTSTLEGVAS